MKNLMYRGRKLYVKAFEKRCFHRFTNNINFWNSQLHQTTPKVLTRD